MEMDAILKLIETDEKTREKIQEQYQKRDDMKQAVEEEKKKISDEAWAEVKKKVEDTKKELDAKIQMDQQANEEYYSASVKRITDMYNANKDTWCKTLVERITNNGE